MHEFRVGDLIVVSESARPLFDERYVTGVILGIFSDDYSRKRYRYLWSCGEINESEVWFVEEFFELVSRKGIACQDVS